MKIITTLLHPQKIILLILIFLGQQVTAQTLVTGTPVPDGDIYSFEKDGNTVYFGGFFQHVNSLSHGSLARFNALTGTLDSWSPSVDNNGVTCLAKAGSKLIAGGSFSAMNGQTRYGICMFDLATGNLDNWSDTANYFSWRMGIGTYNNYFYYCRVVDFSGNCRLVCVDANTGNFTSWQADSLIQGSVNAIYVSGSYVYVGGQFTFTGGSSVYNDLCRFDQATGALDLTWHPQPAINNFGITAIVNTNSGIFVGGDFNTIAGQARQGVAGFDASGNLTGFNQNSSSYEVLSLYGDGDYVWVGGNSWMLGGQSRYRIAQIKISNSSATCWDASGTSNTWSTVQALLVSGDTVFAGPYGSPRLSVFTGSPLPLQGMVISGPSSVLPNQSATYSVPYVAGNSYVWNVTGGSGTSTTNSINITWGAGPSGTLTVTENNPAGSNCLADTTLQVSIGTGTLVEPVYGTGKSFSIFPNPSNGIFTVKSNANDLYRLVIFDLCGRELLKTDFCNKQCSINIEDYQCGIYLLKIETGSEMFIQKLVKE